MPLPPVQLGGTIFISVEAPSSGGRMSSDIGPVSTCSSFSWPRLPLPIGSASISSSPRFHRLIRAGQTCCSFYSRARSLAVFRPSTPQSHLGLELRTVALTLSGHDRRLLFRAYYPRQSLLSRLSCFFGPLHGPQLLPMTANEAAVMANLLNMSVNA